MPSHVKAFWWISLVVAVYSILSAGGAFLFPTSQYLSELAKLLPQSREVFRGLLVFGFVVLLIRCAVMLALAWFAAFRHQNWARWTSAVIIVGFKVIAIGFGFYLHRLAGLIDPTALVIFALQIAAVVFVFTGNARDWFKTPSALEKSVIS